MFSKPLRIVSLQGALALALALCLIMATRNSVQGQTPVETPTPTIRPTAPPPTLPPPPVVEGGIDPALAALADADLLDLRLLVGRLQLEYRAQYGHYWQGAATHTEPLDPLRPAPPDPLAAVGEDPSWYDMGIPLPADLAATVRVDVYNGPRGQGYIMVAQLRTREGLWERTVNIGPEYWLTENWHLVRPDA